MTELQRIEELAATKGWTGGMVSLFVSDIIDRFERHSPDLEWIGPSESTVKACMGEGPRIPACPICRHWAGISLSMNKRTGYYGATVSCMDWQCACAVHSCQRTAGEAEKAALLKWSARLLPGMSWGWDSTAEAWQLAIDGRGIATVWKNGTWHTWDQQGTGGENSREDHVSDAKCEALLSAIKQGFHLPTV